MAKRINNAGREIVVDRVIQLSQGGVGTFPALREGVQNEGIKNLSIRIDGPREVPAGGIISLTARIYYVSTDKHALLYDNNSYYTWTEITDQPDKWTAKGQQINVPSSIIRSGDKDIKLMCTMSNGELSVTTTIAISYKKIKQYTWSIHSSYTEFDKEEHVWYDDIPKADNTYLWTRESVDGGAHYEYYRVSGVQGPIGETGPQGETGPSSVVVEASIETFTFETNSAGQVPESAYGFFMDTITVRQGDVQFKAVSGIPSKNEYKVTLGESLNITGLITEIEPTTSVALIKFDTLNNPYFDALQDYAKLDYIVEYVDGQGRSYSLQKVVNFNKSKQGSAGIGGQYYEYQYALVSLDTGKPNAETVWGATYKEPTADQISWTRQRLITPTSGEPIVGDWESVRPTSASYEWIVQKNGQISTIQQDYDSIVLKAEDTGVVKKGQQTIAGITITPDAVTLTGETVHINKGVKIQDDTLFTTNQKILDGGCIYGGAFGPDGKNPKHEPGFYVNSSGTISAFNSSIHGEFTCSTFEKVDNNIIEKIVWKTREGSQIKDVPCSTSPKRWNEMDAYYAIDMPYENSYPHKLVDCTYIHDGKRESYCAVFNFSGDSIKVDNISVRPNKFHRYYLDVAFDCQIQVVFNNNGVLTYEIKLNNIIQEKPEMGLKLNVHKGDSLDVYVKAKENDIVMGGVFVVVPRNNYVVITRYFAFTGTNGDQILYPLALLEAKTYYYDDSVVLQVPNYFDSEQSRDYVPATGWADGIEDGKTAHLDPSYEITENGIRYKPVKVSKSGFNLDFVMLDGTIKRFYTYQSNYTGFFKISGTYRIENVKRGVTTDNIFPDGDNQKSIGTSAEQYKDAWIYNIFCKKKLSLTDIPTSKDGLIHGEVWRDGDILKIV